MALYRDCGVLLRAGSSGCWSGSAALGAGWEGGTRGWSVAQGCSVPGEEEDGEEGAQMRGQMDGHCLCMAMGDEGTEAGLN